MPVDSIQRDGPTLGAGVRGRRCVRRRRPSRLGAKNPCTGDFRRVVSGLRYYNPSTGRWLSSDPIGDAAFRRLNRSLIQRGSENAGELKPRIFVGNSPIATWDFLGLDDPGCTLPAWLVPGSPNGDCYLRCCAQHDACYYNRPQHLAGTGSACTAASWGLVVCPISYCGRCNRAVVGCFARCLSGINPPEGDLYFCSRGAFQGITFNIYEDIPEDCWENNAKPPNPD